jgi:Holliday junction resolvasome RuvABC endonuclease subunit
VFVAIDYSYTSPAICVSRGPEFINNRWYYLNDTKKRVHQTFCLNGTLFPEFDSNWRKFNYVSDWALDILSGVDIIDVHLEGYSMNSQGQVFNIAENTMLLKYKLINAGKRIKILSPNTIKKFATGKGNADKEKMQEAFKAQTGVDLKDLLNQPLKAWNPSSDIIDAYFIARYADAMQDKKDSYYQIIP